MISAIKIKMLKAVQPLVNASCMSKEQYMDYAEHILKFKVTGEKSHG